MNKIIRYLLALLVVIDTILLIFAFKGDSHNYLHNLKDADDFNENWSVKTEDEIIEDVTFPYVLSRNAGSICELRNTVPKKWAGKTLYFFSMNKNVSVELDGEQIYKLENDKEGSSPGALFNMVNLPEDFKDGSIVIKLEILHSEKTECFASIKVVERDDVTALLFNQSFWEIAASVGIAMFAFIILIMAILSKTVTRSSSDVNSSVNGILYLGAYAICAAVYYLVLSRFPSSYLGYTVVFDYMEYITMMIMPIFMSCYYARNVLSDYRKAIGRVVIVMELNVLVQTVIKVCGVLDFCQMAGATLVCMLLSLIVVEVCMIKMTKREPTIFTHIHLVCISIILIGFIMDCVRNTLMPAGRYGEVAYRSRMAAFIYLFVLTITHVFFLYKNYELNMKVKAILLEQQIDLVNIKNEEMEQARIKAEDAEREANKANEAKSNFLARISHEIRTPINAVLGMDEMILQETKDVAIKSYATDIKGAGKNLLSLINDILDFSKIESGKMELTEIDYDLFAMINDLDTMTYYRAEAKNLEFVVDVDPNLPSLLHGDDLRIKQIIINLLTNAVKYTESGSVKLIIKGTYINEDKINLHIWVTDTGIGIKPEDIDKLYEKFQRIEETRNRNIEGTGLGMNIAVSLLGMMNSELHVMSTYGEGTTFFFDLEQEVVDNEPMGDYNKLSEKIDGAYKSILYAPKANVLVIDDNVMNCKVFSNLLKKTAINVTEGNSGKECLSLVKEHHYDIIFMDHMMPDMDGIETHRNMMNMDHMCKDTPVIIFTANAIKGAKEMYLKEGFNDFITKPIIPEQLEDMIRAYLPKELIQDSDNPVAVMNGDNKTQGVEDLPVIEGVDWKIAMLHFSEMDMLLDTAKNYYQTLATSIEDIEALYANLDNDLDNYRIKVHALKSTSALIGAMTVSTLAKLLEFAARDNEIDTIHSIHPVLVKEASKLWEALDEEFAVDKEKVSDGYIKDLLEILKGKANQLDIDAMDEIMAQLEKYSVKKEVADNYKKLAAAVVNVDIDEALMQIDEMLSVYQ